MALIQRSGPGTGSVRRDGGTLSLPDIGDLASRLRFCFDEGRIWLDDQRMLLLHLTALSALREQLVTELGPVAAKRSFMRMGYISGARDAELVRKVRPSRDPVEAFAVGPQMHMLEGIVQVEPQQLEMDVERGHYFGDFVWHNSVEDDVHLGLYGVGSEPACWMQLGYASGYTSAFMGRPILYREVECRSMGHPRCRIIGRPAEAWPDGEEEAGVKVVSLGVLDPDHGSEDPSTGRGQLIGSSSGFLSALHKLERVARANTTVLLMGETGVGKERFARMLHESGLRADAPFVAVNCSAIPRDLIEAELFGVERGAYTGAVESRAGRFERAEGGTLFLDELGTLAPSAQAKLLRALQEREVERVGGTCARKVDVRVVAATNVDLRDEVEAGRFRADLYFRVGVFPIRIPPLRERRDDIPRLVAHFVKKFGAIHGKTPAGFTRRAVDALLDYDYPGNIRELENIIERAIILCVDDEPVDRAHLFDQADPIEPSFFAVGRDGRLGDPCELPGLCEVADQALDSELSLDDLEGALLQKAVERAQGNLSLAAKMVGLTRPQLAYRLKKRSESKP